MNDLLLLLILGVSIAGVVLIAMLIAKERTSAREARDEMNRIMSSFAGVQNAQFETLRGAVEQRLERIQQDNSAKLEQMRQTVDEKLHATLQSIRRRATIRVIPTDGGYLLEVLVQKELEDIKAKIK